MKLLRVEANNFKCYRELEFSFSHPNGLYLITGENEQQPRLGANGAGKSTLFDALCWGLYGETPKKHKAGTLKSRNGGSGYNVTLYIDVDGVEHTIYRSWKPNKLQLDGDDVDQAAIDRLVRLTYEQFLYTILLRQSGLHFVDLTAGAKLQFLSDIFELDRIVRAGEHVKEQLKAQKTEQSIAEAKRDHLLASCLQVEETRKDLAAKQKEFWTQVKSERAAITQEILTLEAQLTDVDLTSAQRDVKSLTDGLNALLSLKNSDATALKNLQKSFYSVEAERKLLVNRLDKLANDAGKDCPSCGQVVAEQHVLGICQNLIPQLNELSNRCKLDEQEISKFELGIRQFEETEAKARQALRESENKLTALKYEADKQQQIRKQIERLNKELTADCCDPTAIMLERLDKQLQEIQTDLATCEETIKEVDAKTKRYEYVSKLFPQYRLALLDEVVKELEIHFNQAFSSLGLNEWSVLVSTDRTLADSSTKKELTIKISNGDDEIDLDTLSGGERQRVKLAVALGISELIKARTGLEWDIWLLDEPCNALSPEGVSDLMDMLKTLSEVVQVYIAEHGVMELANFDRVFKVIKDKTGCSTIQAA